MTQSNEAKLIRRWLEQERPGRGRKYTPALRQRILAFVEESKRAGMSVREVSEAIGVSRDTILGWRSSEPASPAEASPVPFEVPLDLALEPVSRALVPVEVTPSTVQIGGGLALVTPSGFRVEGLSLEQAFALVREFA
jgi:transposase